MLSLIQQCVQINASSKPNERHMTLSKSKVGSLLVLCLGHLTRLCYEPHLKWYRTTKFKKNVLLSQTFHFCCLDNTKPITDLSEVTSALLSGKQGATSCKSESDKEPKTLVP